MARKRKRKPRRLPKLNLESWATALLWERVPLNCSAYDRDVERKAKALGAEFARTHAHLSDEDPQLLNILDVMLPWVRARGYPVLDEPVCEYASFRREWCKLWGPPLETKSPESTPPPPADGDGPSQANES